MRLTRFSFATALASIALLASTAAAHAADRHAVATGGATSGACAADSPCRLDYAVSGALANDSVILAPGDYNVAWAVSATVALNVTGTTGQPRPRLIGDASRVAPTLNLQYGGSVKHLYVESKTSYAALSTKGVLIEDVIAYSGTGPAIVAKAGGGATIRDSVAQSDAASGDGDAATAAALDLKDDQVTGNLDVINVTAIATGAGSRGIGNGSGGVVSIVNTIARGQANDIYETVTVRDAEVSYSNYRPAASTGVVAGSGNQSGDPLFGDAQYRPSASSPTIDAGTASVLGLGTADPDGNLRTLGLAPDIGAYEYVAAGGGSGDGGSGSGSGSGGSGPAPGTGTSDPTGTTTTTTGTSTKTDPTGSPTQLPPSAPPVLGESVALGAVRGTVRVILPGGAGPVVLEEGASVPVGSVVDARDGVVELTSVRDDGGETQTGRFWGGKFRVKQSASGHQYTVLKLVGRAAPCSARGKVSAAGRRRRGARRLWGRDRHGRFRTRGRRGQATVRGTKWLTEDRCGGTLFRVKRGAIVVRDFAKRKRVKLTRGERYVARAR